MSTLDHTAYPYIMDQVIKYASTQALFKLRLTSKSLRGRVDNVLATHVFLGGTTSYKDPNPTMYLPKTLRFTSGPTSWALDAPPSSVRTLDLDDTLVYNVHIDRILRPFDGVTTLRRFWPADGNGGDALTLYRETTAHTIVDFIPINPVSEKRYIALSPVSRRIVHLRAYGASAPIRFHNNHEVDLATSVVVLWPPNPTQAAQDNGASDYVFDAFYAVESILRASPRRLVVVGLQRLCTWPNPSTGRSELSGVSRYKMMVGFLQYVLVALGTDVDLRFLAVEEWWEELEEGEKELIGIWPSEYA